jgi:uncharacterized protein
MKISIDLLATDELDYLDKFLMSRLDENNDSESLNEGIYCTSELDGFFTAVVSSPILIKPSGWMPVIWGDFEPEWENEDEFMKVFSLMTRHMNGIVNNLMSDEAFIPLFLESPGKGGKKYLVVDEWCNGYMRGVQMVEENWELDSMEMGILLAPISIFASLEGWDKLDEMNNNEIENIQNAIVPNVEEIHAYWLNRREHETPEMARTYQKDSPSIGRNDPCPCGSGKKFKKCCLH